MIAASLQKISSFLRRNWKTACLIPAFALFVAIAQAVGLDKRAIVILVVFFGYVTQLFGALVGLVRMVPLIGPPIATVVSLPFFLVINAVAYLVTLFSLHKGYAKDVVDSKVMVTALLVGIIIGYALGKLF